MTLCSQCNAEMLAESKFCQLCGHPTHPFDTRAPLAVTPSKVELKYVGILIGIAIPFILACLLGLNAFTLLLMLVPFAIVGFAIGAIADSLNKSRLHPG
jgi:hypothetical protein